MGARLQFASLLKEVMTMTKRPLAIATAAVIVGALAAAGATSTAPRVRTQQAGGPVNALAFGGPLVAYDVGNAKIQHGSGNRVLVWNVVTGKTTKVSGRFTDSADITSTGRGVRELAIAGTRVAWIVNWGGNTESDDYLYASTAVKPSERRLASATRLGEPPVHGKWIGGLVGSGNLVAVNSWTTAADRSVATAGLYTLGAKTLRSVVAGPSTLEAAAADGGRIVVVRTDGTLALSTPRPATCCARSSPRA
jgi:hypothetical protein